MLGRITGQTYRVRDLDDFFRGELRMENKKLSIFPYASKAVQEVGKKYEEVDMVWGFGDMFRQPRDGGMGHLADYFRFRRKLGKMGEKVSDEVYQKRAEGIRSLFTSKAHRDYDIGVVAEKEQLDKEALRCDMLNSLNKSLQEMIEKDNFLKDINISQTGLFTGFDLRSQVILSVNEFLNTLKEQQKVAKAFPYNSRVSDSSVNSLKFEKSQDSESITIFTEPKVPITVSDVKAPPSGTRERKAFITVEPGHRLPEPLADILENGNGTIIHMKDTNEELKNTLQEYRRLTNLPRKLSSQIKTFQDYMNSIKLLGLGSDVNQSAIKSESVLQELSV